ncbi:MULTISPECIES: hypothetical protein [Mycolicibacterium]|uniref:hypothetical protein n=1 Tax=Mycolicibacterium monacense TaxID=85693 RepID=UPI0007EB1354|nr:hypothetical protein [Mycolicibacterium monacense]OBB66069.1 hypothetical protein A6B34_22375 [Mycolicibacterium monacense]OBF53928.1 hypothetical protein A5778_11095 [Mycolicibacterium monacense]
MRCPPSPAGIVFAALAAVLVPTTAGCDSTPYPTGENFTTTVQSPPDGAAVASEPAPVVLDIGISDGSVRPMNATVSAAVGQRVELRVDSDKAGRIEVTTDPVQTFDLLPRDDQVFGFTADEPGTVTVEVRDPDRTVATVQVGQ